MPLHNSISGGHVCPAQKLIRLLAHLTYITLDAIIWCMELAPKKSISSWFTWEVVIGRGMQNKIHKKGCNY